jgi:aldehyde:ferredoxin oxidoreductase
MINTALGWEWDIDRIMTTGKRIVQIKRLINLRLGVTPADDTLPKRFLTEPRPTGSAAGNLPDMELMLPVYYRLRDWDETGGPSRERCEELGLPLA